MKRKAQIAIGLAIGVTLVWLLFRGTDWAAVGEAIRSAHGAWLVLAFLGVLVSFVTRILRWGYIVRTAKPVSFRSMFSATQIGFLANFTLPGRAGEVIRALVLARLERLPFSKCFAFVALDRLTDLIGLIVVLIISVLAFHPDPAIHMADETALPEWASTLLQPGAIRAAALSAAIVLVGLAGGLVLLYVNQRLVLRILDRGIGAASTRLAERVHGLLQQFAEGLHIFRSGLDMAKSVFFSLVTWSMFAVTYGSTLRAFEITLPWYGPFIVLSFVAVAISLPGAPAFVGQFHAAIVAAVLLLQPTADLDVARAAAIIAHLINVVPVTAVGLYCLYTEKLGLLELRRAGERAGPGAHDEPPPEAG